MKYFLPLRHRIVARPERLIYALCLDYRGRRNMPALQAGDIWRAVFKAFAGLPSIV